jgi:hypothetical protein
MRVDMRVVSVCDTSSLRPHALVTLKPSLFFFLQQGGAGAELLNQWLADPLPSAAADGARTSVYFFIFIIFFGCPFKLFQFFELSVCFAMLSRRLDSVSICTFLPVKQVN